MARRRSMDPLRPDARWNRVAPWPVVAVLSGIGAAGVGWCLAAAGCLLGWLQATQTPVPSALRLAVSWWLSAHFARVDVGDATLSVAPLGLTAAIVAIGAGLASSGVQHAFDAAPPPSERRRWVGRMAGLFLVGYAGVATAAAIVTLPREAVPRAVVGALVVGVVMAVWGVGRVLGARLDLEIVRLHGPRWLDALPRAVAAGGGVMLTGGGAVCALTLMQHHRQVVALADSLGAGTLGGLVLLGAQAAWFPNVVLWAASWTCGAGFSLGQGTIVAPLATQIGLLPTIPLLGAVPAAGVASKAMALWLIVPMAAGVVAAWVLTTAFLDDAARSGRAAASRPDRTALVGALAGAAMGVLTAAVISLAGGDLGQGRLTGLGAYLPGLWGLAPTTMALAGVVTGTVIGARRYVRAVPDSPSVAPAPAAGLEVAEG